MPDLTPSPGVRVETFKLLRSWTPRWSAIALVAAAVVPTIVLLFRPSVAPTTYYDAFTTSFAVVSPLVATVFGAWLLGSEYRQHTVRRMLAVDPRRTRTLLTKAAVGLTGFAVAWTTAAGLGWLSASALASARGVTFASPGDALIELAIITFVVAVVAIGLSALSRSDSVAIAGTLGLLIIVDPVLTSLPTVGQYSFGSALDWFTYELTGAATDGVAGASVPELGAVAGAITLTVWMALAIVPGALRFARSDV